MQFLWGMIVLAVWVRTVLYFFNFRLHWLMIIGSALGPARKYANVAAFPNQLWVFRSCFRVRQGCSEALLEHQWKSASVPLFVASPANSTRFVPFFLTPTTGWASRRSRYIRLCRLYVQQISEQFVSATFERCSPVPVISSSVLFQPDVQVVPRYKGCPKAVRCGVGGRELDQCRLQVEQKWQMGIRERCMVRYQRGGKSTDGRLWLKGG